LRSESVIEVEQAALLSGSAGNSPR